MMKILFISPYLPTVVRVRPYQFIRHLAQLGHKITLVYYDSPTAAAPDTEIRAACEKIFAFQLPKKQIIFNGLRALPTRTPFQAKYGWLPAMYKQLVRLINDPAAGYELIHIEHIRGVIYGEELKARKKIRSLPMVWDSVDSITYLFRQAARQHPSWIKRTFLNWEAQRTAGYEPKVAALFEQTFITSETDRLYFLSNGTNTPNNMCVVPNGVDLDYFSPGYQQREEKTLVISGKMSYHANEKMVLRLVEEILPLIWEKDPEVKLWIVGQNPGERIRQLGTDKRITITGWVEDMRPYLQKATLAIAPLAYGAGIQNKVLEAMACETPVVTSTSALQAIKAENGIHLFASDDPALIAEQVLFLLKNGTERNKMGKAGRIYVEKHHSWSSMALKLTKIYQLALK
jgi:glycosyltransferase involved in cell wall biosynthesis